MTIEIRGICMCQKSVIQYVRRVHKNERNAEKIRNQYVRRVHKNERNAQYKISLLGFNLTVFIVQT